MIICFTLPIIGELYDRNKNLNVSLGGTHILKDINLSIKEENSIIGIFGPNGAGKTTLISVLTGSINNYTGAVKGICAKDISYLPDKPFIYRYMKLEDAIKYYKDALMILTQIKLQIVRKTWIKIESENFPVFQRYA